MTSRAVVGFALTISVLLGACGTNDAPATTDPTTTTDTGATDTDSSETASDEQATTTTAQATVPVTASTTPSLGSEFPDIIAVRATPEDSGTWRFDVTVSSPYDTPDRYADAWRVVDPDGNELGIRVLTHDHANEQPFTRSQTGIAIPADVTEVTVQGRDQANGWGGGELTITLP